MFFLWVEGDVSSASKQAHGKAGAGWSADHPEF